METQTFANGERGAPLWPQDVEADASVRVDVWVVDSRREGNLGRFEGVVRRKVDRQEKYPALVRGVGLGEVIFFILVAMAIN